MGVNELRGGYLERKYVGTNLVENYVQDTRKQVIQVIEFIKSLVQPGFDKVMKAEYEDIKKEQELNYNNYAISDSERYVTEKLKLMLRLFERMNFFFERDEYFKSKPYREQYEDADDIIAPEEENG